MSSSDPNSPRETPQSPTQRRSSFVDMFNPRASMSSQNSSRRLSITTLGLSTLPQAQPAPFSAMRTRAESTSSANSNSVDESPFEEDNASSSPGSVPPTPFARRMSIGAQRALRGATGGGGGAGGGSNNGANEGYDFAEKLRARAERASVSNGYAGSAYNQSPTSQPHQRSKSVAVMEPPKVEPAARQQRPDAFQERILKGDFYMD